MGQHEMKGISSGSQEVMVSNSPTLQEKKLRPRLFKDTPKDQDLQS